MHGNVLVAVANMLETHFFLKKIISCGASASQKTRVHTEKKADSPCPMAGGHSFLDSLFSVAEIGIGIIFAMETGGLGCLLGVVLIGAGLEGGLYANAAKKKCDDNEYLCQSLIGGITTLSSGAINLFGPYWFISAAAGAAGSVTHESMEALFHHRNVEIKPITIFSSSVSTTIGFFCGQAYAVFMPALDAVSSYRWRVLLSGLLGGCFGGATGAITSMTGNFIERGAVRSRMSTALLDGVLGCTTAMIQTAAKIRPIIGEDVGLVHVASPSTSAAVNLDCTADIPAAHCFFEPEFFNATRIADVRLVLMTDFHGDMLSWGVSTEMVRDILGARRPPFPSSLLLRESVCYGAKWRESECTERLGIPNLICRGAEGRAACRNGDYDAQNAGHTEVESTRRRNTDILARILDGLNKQRGMVFVRLGAFHLLEDDMFKRELTARGISFATLHKINVFPKGSTPEDIDRFSRLTAAYFEGSFSSGQRITKLEEIAGLFPTNIDVHNELANLYNQAKQFEKVKELYRRFMNATGKEIWDLKALRHLSVAAAHLHDRASAIRYLEKAIKLMDRFGLTYYKNKAYKAIALTVKAALAALDPGNPNLKLADDAYKKSLTASDQ